MNDLKMSYKEALAEIEGIVDKIENGNLDVDELSLMINRASELLQFCKMKLKSTEEELNRSLEEF